jgi:HrpA-like RNA helicase
MQVTAVSQSQANQRAGRAGRESPGTCFRLYTEDTFSRLEVSSKPEVQRVGIAQVVLQLFVIGVTNPLAFPFPSPPSSQSLQKSLKQLFRLGAISVEVHITLHDQVAAMLNSIKKFIIVIHNICFFNMFAEKHYSSWQKYG